MSEYKVGDVIAFRVIGEKRVVHEGNYCLFNGYERNGGKIHISHNMTTEGLPLERIPNPVLMDGAAIEAVRDVHRYVFAVGEGDFWRQSLRPYVQKAYDLICKRKSPCPELKAKIDKLEQELAALKKEALG